MGFDLFDYPAKPQDKKGEVKDVDLRDVGVTASRVV
jgi:hypothetical protein